jgi:hypothetical protein
MYKIDTPIVVYNLLFACEAEILNLAGTAAIRISSALESHKRMFDLTFQSARPYSFSKYILVTFVTFYSTVIANHE